MALLAGLVYLTLFIVALVMASNRNRSILGCVLSNLVMSPVASIVILLLIGEA